MAEPMLHDPCWTIVFVHKTNIAEKEVVFSANGSPDQIKEQCTMLYKETVAKSKRMGYKTLLLEPALAIVHCSDMAMLANPLRHENLTAAYRNPELILTSTAVFFDNYRCLDIHQPDYKGHICVMFLEPNKKAVHNAKLVGNAVVAAIPLAAGIAGASACVIL